MKITSIRLMPGVRRSLYAFLVAAVAVFTLFSTSDLFTSRVARAGSPTSGVLDPTFAGGVTEGNTTALVSAVQSDGKILLGGGFSLINGVAKNTLARVNTDGTIDASFNPGGLGPTSNVYAIKVLADGKILISGGFTSYNGTPAGGIARLNSDGTLDPTFNPGGAGANGVVQGMTIQSDGKIVISSGSMSVYNGTSQRTVARLNPDGTLDPTFTSPFASVAFVEDTRQQTDGKIVICGSFSLGGKSNIARLNPDGSVDSTFNVGGTGANDGVFALEIQPDGKILIGGGFTTYNGVTRSRAARLNVDGSLDNAFTPPSSNGNGAEYFDVLPDGKILVAGGFDDGTSKYALVRLNADGTVDQTFQIVNSNNTGYHVTRQTDGKIILTGYFSQVNGAERRNFVRLDANGNVDTTFIATASGFGYAAAIAQQPDGKIIAAGNFNVANGVAHKAIVRFNLDGTLDPTFDSGVGTFPDPANAGNNITAVAVQADGKIVIAGNFGGYRGFASRGVARLNANGTADTTFNPAPLNSMFNTFTNDMLIQPDGKIMVVGLYLTTPENGSFGFRLNPDGSQDSGYFIGGINSGSAIRVTRQPDGKLVIVGSFTQFSGASRNRIVRLNADGTVDTAFAAAAASNGTILAATVQPDGKILIGGTFTSYDGTARARLARLNADSTLDTSFDPGTGPNGSVENISVQSDGQLFIAGRFSTVNGTPSSRVARLNPNGSVDGSFVSGFDTDLRFFARRTLVQLDGKVLVSGLFTTYSGQTRNALVRLYKPEVGGGTQPILFTSTRNGNNDIYKMNADGTNQQQLTNAAEGESGAKWSPDGSKIIYTKTVTSVNLQVWTMNADGSNKTMVSNASGYNLSIDWSPDGRKILFGTSASPTQISLWTMDADGGNKLQITNSSQLDHFAKWSPDGSKVAFGRCDASFVCDIYTVNANGSGLTNLTAGNAGDDDSPVWIENGSRIIFSRGGTGFYDIFRMNADGTNVQRLTTTSSPVAHYIDGGLSPDGAKLAFDRSSVTGTADQVNNSYEVYTMNIDGSAQTNLTNNAVYDFFGAWSPDSQAIAYHTRNSGVTRNEIYTVNANGTGRTRLTFNEAHDTVTDWFRPRTAPSHRSPFDFDGDGKTDIGIYRPSAGEWWYQRSSDGIVPAFGFGTSTDKIVPGDYTGDGRADIAFWRPSTGEWFILRSEDASYYSFPFGAGTDVPVPADYDGDGKTDAAVFRPSTGTWYINNSGGGTTITTFGANGDNPVPADYDGDGKADVAIYRPSAGQWWLNRSSAGLIAIGFGEAADLQVQGDYTGDGKADVALFRPSTGTWFILRSEDMSYYSFPFGAGTDTPAPGDYDGDGKWDPTVFRSSAATWYVQRSTAGTQIVTFGASIDRPIPNAFVP